MSKFLHTSEKHLIIGGCSYHWKNNPSGFPNHSIPIFHNRYNNHWVGMSSVSIEYIKESIIHKIGELLNKGVDPSEIYVLSNLTQIGRNFVKYPEYLLLELSDGYKKGYKIGNYVTTSLIHIEKNVVDWEKEQISNINNSRLPIQNFEIYLENIVILQSFLKTHKIANTLFMMNNVFEGWYDDFRHVYSSITGPIVPDLSNTLHIKDMSDYCKYLWNIIDLDNFIFHKTSGNNYGGIDEYALDKFKGDSSLYYQDPTLRDNFWYGNHPNPIVYHSFSDTYGIANKIFDTLE
jgi:hypothetical protein